LDAAAEVKKESNFIELYKIFRPQIEMRARIFSKRAMAQTAADVVSRGLKGTSFSSYITPATPAGFSLGGNSLREQGGESNGVLERSGCVWRSGRVSLFGISDGALGDQIRARNSLIQRGKHCLVSPRKFREMSIGRLLRRFDPCWKMRNAVIIRDESEC
jgi:hypothetical protein